MRLLDLILLALFANFSGISAAASGYKSCFGSKTLPPPPVAQCRDITVALGANHTVNVPAAAVDNGSSGTNPLTFLINGQPSLSFDCTHLGAQSVTLTVVDANSNTASCSATVTVHDYPNPINSLVCNDLTQIMLDPNCSATVGAGDILEGGPYRCFQTYQVELDKDPPYGNGPWQPATLGATDAGKTYQVRVTDPSTGNRCWGNVQVVDGTAPMALCRDITVELNSSGTGTATAAAVDNGSSDACGLKTLTLSKTSFSCANIGPNTVTLTATDNSNNQKTCSATVFVRDNVPPDITCPGPLTVPCDAYVPAANIAAAHATDNCGTPVVTYEGEVISDMTCVNRKTITRTYKATDNGNNTSTCSQIITVFDNNKPGFVSVPSDVTVQCNSPLPAVGNPLATDGCGSAGLMITYNGQSQTNGTCANSYFVIRQWTATDACGNTQTATQRIAVADLTAPVFTAVPANVTIQCNSPLPAVGTPQATDACGGTVTIAYNGQTQTNGNCANNYILVRQWTATDVCGNAKTATQRITVTDLMPPVFTSVPANVTVQCHAIPAVGTATATDGCSGSVSIVYNGQTTIAGPCTDTYTLTRKWTASDACGNTRTATQRITVTDTKKPAFTFVPPLVIVECSDMVPPVGSASATDNCDASVSVVLLGQYTASSTQPNAYLIIRVWQATDNCGNYTTASQTIIVQDTQPPGFVSVPPHITIECSDPFPVTPGTPAATDNCDLSVQVSFSGQTTAPGSCPPGYVVTRTWTAYDDYGNSRTATQTITVVDTQAPVFINPPADITLACTDPIPPAPGLTASDACDNSTPVTYVGEVNTGPNCPYTITRTWTAADDCGNATAHVQTITVLTPLKGGEGAERTNTVPALENIRLMPNPARDEVWIGFDAASLGMATVRIVDVDSRLVLQQQFPTLAGTNRYRLDLSGMAAGVYVVRLNAGGQVAAEKLVVFRN